jgi:hypothetical protein
MPPVLRRVWRRRMVGWEAHAHESAERAATLMQRICTERLSTVNHSVLLHLMRFNGRSG